MNIDKIGLSAIWTDWSKALEKIIMPNQDENVPIMFDESPDEEPAVDIDYNDPKNQFSQTGLNITKFKNTVSRAEAFKSPKGFVTDD